MKQNFKNRNAARQSKNTSIVSRHRWLLRLAGIFASFALLLLLQPTESRAQFAPPDRTVRQNSSPLSAPQTITATKTVDKVIANPGDTLTYTVNITATGTDATSVFFTDTLTSTLALVGGSVAASPVAVNDTYPQTLVGNVSIDSSLISFSVTSNDYMGFNTPTATTISAYDATSAQCVVISCVNNVSMTTSGAGMGQFTYNPPPGFTGTDTFTYTLTDNANASSAAANRTATVSITVSGMVWFINNNAASCTTLAAGCGRLSNPFSTLAAFNTLNNGSGNNPAANDNIFIYESSTQYTGAVTLLSGQKLIGQDATALLSTITGLTPPSSSPLFPAMNSANGTITNIGSTVTLNTNATVRGLKINSTTSTGMNDPAGAITGVSVSEVSVSTTTGTAVSLSSISGTLSFTSISANGGTKGISVSSLTGSFTSNGGTIQSTSARGAEFITTSNGVSNSVILNNMTFTNATTVDGADPTNQAGTCGSMHGGGSNTGCNAPIFFDGVSRASLDTVTVSGSTQMGININASNNVTMNAVNVSGAGNNPNEFGMNIHNLTGTNNWSGINIHDNPGANHQVYVEGQDPGAASTFNITGSSQFTCALQGGTTRVGGNLLSFDGYGASADMAVTVTGATFTGSSATAILFHTQQSGGSSSLTVTGSSFTANNSQIDIARINGAAVGFNISNNGTALAPMTGANFGEAINVFSGNPSSGLMNGTIANNHIGDAATAGSGCSGGCGGIFLTAISNSTITANIADNFIHQVSSNAINATAGQLTTGNTNTINVTITHNTIDTPAVNTVNAIFVESGTSSTQAAGVVCAAIGDFTGTDATKKNMITGNWGGSQFDPFGAPILLRQRFAIDTFRIAGYTPSGVVSSNHDANAETFVNSHNTITPNSGPNDSGKTVAATVGATAYTGGAGACALPTAILLPNHSQGVAQNQVESDPMDGVQVASTGLNSANAFNFPSGFANLFKQAVSLTHNVKPIQSINLAKYFSSPFVSVAEASALNNSGIQTGSAQGTAPLGKPMLFGETVSVGPIPTLPAGKSVTIKFQATIENPFTSGATVSNTGTVSGGNFSPVQTTTATTNINLPDLRAAKTNNVGGSATLGSNWTWTIAVTNTGTFTATFGAAQTIISDTLPNANIGYTLTTPSIILSAPNSGTVDCSINGTQDLSCTANPTVTLGISGTFSVQLTATPTAIGTFANPRVSGSCSVDPNNVVNEGNNENNNTCSNSVNVVAADLIVSKSNNVGGTVQLGNPFTWTLTISNTGSGAAVFAPTTTILTDTLDNSGGLTYGTPAVLNPVNITNSGNINCAINGSSTLSCIASGSTITVGATTGKIDVAVPVTPTIAATYVNPRSGGTCQVNPNNAVLESDTTNNLCNSNTVTVTVSDLTIAKSHTGNFTQGQIGATYTITATNIGNGSTSGTVYVTDTLPSGLTATGFAGTGWTCTLSPLTCSRSNALAPSSSYASLTLTVTVAANASAVVTNTVQVAGGGEFNTSNDVANDQTNITQLADLTIAKSHSGNFTQGQIGATYLITVTNSGFASTSGTVTVTDTLPVSLTATGFSGTNWTCASLPTLSCSRSDALTAGNSYEPITLAVNVSANAPALVTNTAFVSGGGEVNTTNDSASDPTTINAGPDMVVAKTHVGSFTQGQVGASYTITVTNSGGISTSGTVLVTDTLPSGLTATGFAGTGWGCTLSPLACSRADALGSSSSYPSLTLTVTVASNAAATITNTVQVAGGGQLNTTNDIANDPTNVLAPPSITSANNTTFTVGSFSTFNVTATGNPQTSMTITRTGTLPGGVSFLDNGNGNATLSGTPNPNTGGIYPLTFNASNGVSPDASQAFTLTVNQAPAITSANAVTFTVGTLGNFTVTTTGFPTTTMSITKTGSLPSNVTFVDNLNGTATLNGTAIVGTGGVYTITIGANNGVAPNANQTFVLTVDEGPAITSANNGTFTVGAFGTFGVTTTGYPKPAISESGTLPAVVGLVDNLNGTATLSGTPSTGTGGIYPITIFANNGFAPTRPSQLRIPLRAPFSVGASQAFTLTVNEAPTITSANAVTFTVGSTGIFTITATGFPTTTMNITRTGSLPGGVSFTDNGNGQATLTGNPNGGTGGVYHLTFGANNGVSPNASQAFTLTVAAAPAITSANSAIFIEGQAGNFTITTSGFPTTTMAISKSGALPSALNFTDNGNATATINGTPGGGTANVIPYPLTITATNGIATTATQSFNLYVDRVPAVVGQPSNQTVCAGNPASFTSTGSGIPAPTIQWEFSTNGGGSFGNVVGAITTTLTFNAQAPQNNNQYRAAFTNRSGISRSNAVTLTVTTVPTITLQPVNVTTTPNQPVSFSANATSNPSPTVQWQVSTDGGANFTDIPGALSTSYGFTSQPSQNGNQYRAVFTSTCGSANTNAATLKIVNSLFRIYLPFVVK